MREDKMLELITQVKVGALSRRAFIGKMVLRTSACPSANCAPAETTFIFAAQKGI
jgi:hypothetical protein